MKHSEEEIIKIILDEAFYVHRRTGPGLLENIYKTCLAHRLRMRGLSVEIEKPIPVFFEDIKMDCGNRADLVVEECVVVEIKSVEGDCLVAHRPGLNLRTLFGFEAWTNSQF